MMNKDFLPIAQENPLGCGLACCASLLGISYHSLLLSNPSLSKQADTRGFYFRDLREILKNLGNIDYECKKYNESLEGKVYLPGTIIFCKPGRYGLGHYILSVGNKLFMNSWINYPELPVKAGYSELEEVGIPEYIFSKTEK